MNDQKMGLDDALASGLTRADLEAMIVDTLPDAGPAWEPPIPLDEPTGPEPPRDCFPEPVQAFADAVALATQTPRGLATALALAVMSAAARGRYEVFVPRAWPRGTAGAAYRCRDGTRRTENRRLHDAGRTPGDVGTEAVPPEAIPVREWQSELAVLEKHLKDAEAAEAGGPKPGKDGKPGTDAATLETTWKAAIADLQAHIDDAIYPTTLLADDITNQRLKELMVQNRGAIAVVSDGGTVPGSPGRPALGWASPNWKPSSMGIRVARWICNAAAGRRSTGHGGTSPSAWRFSRMSYTSGVLRMA